MFSEQTTLSKSQIDSNSNHICVEGENWDRFLDLLAPALRISMPRPWLIVNGLVLFDPGVLNAIEEVIDNISEEVNDVVLV